MTLEEVDAKITAITLQVARLSLELEAAITVRRELVRSG